MMTRIRELREARGLTQNELAQKLGLSQPAIVKWERGDYLPRTETLFLLADILGVSVDQLCERKTPGDAAS